MQTARHPRKTTALPALSLALLLGLAAAPGRAAQLQITVLGLDGKPAANVVVQAVPSAAWQPQPLPAPAEIAQQNIRFEPFVTVVPVGGSVRFVNRDRFDHHVRSLPGGPLGNVAPAQQFEFRMAAIRSTGKATSAEVKLDVPGTIALGCHLHGSMRGHVLVSTTPWAGVSDDKGLVSLADVPDGQLELKLWHPDQLTDQASSRLQAQGSMQQSLKINLTPRRRPPPPPSSDYAN